MKINERHKAKELRRHGFSLKEIAERLSVAKSSVSMWVRDITLSEKAERRLLTKITVGQLTAARNKKAKTKAVEESYLQSASEELKDVRIDQQCAKLLCAIMYWCEGVKSPMGGVCFINSDPDVIKKFLTLLRASFAIDEKKFRPCVHLHSYHSSEKQLDFWSKITDINKSQFIKPYRKLNSGKRVRENYQGCIAIKYYSNDLARRLLAIGKAFFEKGV